MNNSQLFLKVQICTNCFENVTKKERFPLYIKQVPVASYFGYNTEGICDWKMVRLVLLEVSCQQKNTLALSGERIKIVNCSEY